MAELIVAFDMPSGREALALAAKLPGLSWAKIGPALYVREGPALVREFRARGVKVFLDLKWHDIPTSVQEAVRAARELGVELATVHTLGGPTMIAAAAAAAGEMALVGVTVLTSHDAGELAQILGRGVPDVGAEVERLARVAVKARLRGVVTSGQELRLVRAVLGTGPWIVVPGIRTGDDALGDQRRTITPADAVRDGATHVVVGRPITRAADPVVVYQRLQEGM